MRTSRERRTFTLVTALLLLTHELQLPHALGAVGYDFVDGAEVVHERVDLLCVGGLPFRAVVREFESTIGLRRTVIVSRLAVACHDDVRRLEVLAPCDYDGVEDEI